ncbi:acyl-CoA synthetase [Sphingopyxis macrogoltabida]|uniref:Acyl-CoA synthetase n=1 Tax=Sphingopyxis macrogoltabida TaxID=33050 RepID=A0A0N9UDI2_SPHMC|nr:acyl-CoA synthetase [Sphingopyxis macrogoltabida]ALH81465.1 acyl-CoA synthetase [Sphingopyxis macrogoltabida]
MHPSVHARLTPDKPAYRMAGSGETVTYAELDARSNQGAHLLRALGLVRGDGIALMLENDARFFEIVWAAQRAGLYYTCISTRLAAPEIAFIIADSGSRVLIASAPVSPEIAVTGLEIFAPGARDFVAERVAFPGIPIDDEAPGIDMLYSSGTTGRPKGIRPALPEGSLDQTNALTEFGRTSYGMAADTVFLSPAPLYHSAPLRWCMAVQKLGGTVIVMEKFDGEAALSLIERFAVTHAQFVPTHFIRMLKLPAETRGRYDLSSLRIVYHAAAPCPVEVKHAMLAWLGPIIHEFYAGTEANGLTAIGPGEWLAHPGSVGRAIWGTLKICDEDGDPLPAGEVGAIHFADGPAFEYHNDPEKTAASRNRHGWTTLGDVGYVDTGGYLYLTDRQSFMIISGGVNIYPQEIEDAIITHPRVADVAVIGAPDPEMGERVVAVVQPADWAEAGPELAEDIRQSLQGRLGRIKQPKQIDFVAELPRHPTGKLLKRLVRERYWPG